jgi:hypothetical protein
LSIDVARLRAETTKGGRTTKQEMIEAKRGNQNFERAMNAVFNVPTVEVLKE